METADGEVRIKSESDTRRDAPVAVNVPSADTSAQVNPEAVH